MKTIFPLLSAIFFAATTTNAAEPKTLVEMKTSQGVILLELDAKLAPITTANFLKYADEGFFDGTIFHRVIDNFMIQGGGFTEKFESKDGHAPIKNEANNGLKNARGTIAMARTNNPHSATSQFFINVKDNNFLDYTPSNPGYAVFGKVVKGIEVVDKIKSIPTGAGGIFPTDVPQTPVIIESVKRKK
jgi:cyclophilin family peptidyl-prolyl cis-trans isomerase